MFSSLAAAALVAGCGTSGVKTPVSSEDAAKIQTSSQEAELAMRQFRVPEGFKVSVWAAEPRLANPVAIATDDQGRWYVCETFRHTDGVLDIRGIMDWLDEELASQSVEERVAIMRRHLTEAQVEAYTRESERVRLLQDRDGDGRADISTVFADGFNKLEDGIAAGVLSFRDRVYLASIPNLYELADTNGDGHADQERILQHGYGVRVGFLGHDLHGLRMGPDGRLYFSIGDRGFNVQQGDSQIARPETGAVFRCDPDGSNLEIVHEGLRNPQELAFDQYGNLFTGDNNSDGGDQARWVQVVEGGDSGWRIGWQFLTYPNPRGAWIAERMDKPLDDPFLQPAYIVPPLHNIGSGPSGLTYYPGTGFSDEYQDHFFLCDFRGSSGASGIHTFRLEPSGASFRVMQLRPFAWGILCTDAEFGVDGGLYVSDWVEGWKKPAKGRIYRVTDPAHVDGERVVQTRELLAEGMSGRSLAELGRLLAHPDQRVRQAAQFECADRGMKAVAPLQQIASTSRYQLARIHAMWALDMISRRERDAANANQAIQSLVHRLDDPDPEIRAQAARLLGDRRYPEAYPGLIKLVGDDHARVRYYAALSLGKLGRTDAAPALLQMLRENNDADAYLRHAGVMALTWIGDASAIASAASDENAGVRMAALLTWRRMKSPEVARFLDDPDARLVLEAARAIHDLPLPEALPALARRLNPTGPDPLLRRALNANYRLGGADPARAIAEFAAQAAAPEAIRAEAIRQLGGWAHPSGRDAITGLWRPIQDRPADDAMAALGSVLDALLTQSPAIQMAAARAAGTLHMTGAGVSLLALFEKESTPPAVRAVLLETLAALEDINLPQAIQRAQDSGDANLRNSANRLLAQARPDEALPRLEASLEKGTVRDQQAALETLAALPSPKVDVLIDTWMQRLLDEKVPAALKLDVLEAAGQRSAPVIKEKIQAYDARRKAEDPMRSHLECLEGGDAERGRRIFTERLDVYCSRCHLVNGQGGVAGPDLSTIGSHKDRLYIMESILYPNARIAEGFESIVVTLQGGTTYAGILTEETEATMEINSPEDGPITVNKAHIESIESGRSGMPEEFRQILSKRDVRDLVEFLSGLK